MTENKILLIFESTRSVILAERECKSKGFKCVAVPTPREYTAQCGIALEVPIEQKNAVIELLNQLGKPYRYYDKIKIKGKSCGI
jgi:hypothetical protein